MPTHELIPFHTQTIAHEAMQTIDARELHGFLGIKKDFTSWVKYQLKRGKFVEQRDYAIFANFGEKGRPTTEYALTIDTAKHIAMMAGTDKGIEAREYFLRCERDLKALMVPAPTLQAFTPRDELETLQLGQSMLEDLGMLDDRDRLMLADRIRTILNPQHLLTAGTPQEAPCFDLSTRVTQLGYYLTRKQSASLLPQLGKRVANEYRSRYGCDPKKRQGYVDGAVRNISQYEPDDCQWLDPIIQSFFAGFPGIQRSELAADPDTL